MNRPRPNGLFKVGERIFLPGSSGEPAALTREVLGADGVNVTTSFVPGINRLLPEMLGSQTRVTGLFMHTSLAEAQRAGSFRHVPFSYAAAAKWLRESPPFDACVLQVSRPDAKGNCSLGPAAEFLPEVLRRARRVIAVVNPCVPRVTHAPSVKLQDCAVVLEEDEPLVRYEPTSADPVSESVAGNVAPFIGDGAALQIGLGKVPDALFRRLGDRRRLRLHSGMLSDGVIALAGSGALCEDWEHTATVLVGSAELYAWSGTRQDMYLRGCEWTHDPGVLSRIEGLIAVNSALEVDLFGQCNLEVADGRAVSGAGGSIDFAHAARLSAGGLSIVALPSSFGKNKSRICATLNTPGIVTLPRTEVDVVVTEHGSADLRGLSVHERAESLIEIAGPFVRSDLGAAWREISARL